jgi:hypothetical protein
METRVLKATALIRNMRPLLIQFTNDSVTGSMSGDLLAITTHAVDAWLSAIVC